LTALTFGAVAMGIGGVYSILSDVYLRDRSRVSQRLDEEFRRKQRERAKKSLQLKDLSKVLADVGELADDSPGLRQRFEAMIEQSGLDLTPERLQLIACLSALGLGAASGLFRQSLVVGVLGALVGASVPLLYVQFTRQARLEKLRSQLPDAFDLMGRVIRAGQTMAQALLAVTDEFAQPIAGEFAYCF